jgi:Asp-tRNA(Asn)/Glu-tRNA(Gln) amidotransferase A subunit family amidase
MTDVSNAMPTAAATAAAIASGAASAEQATRSCLARIAAIEDEVRAFQHLDTDYALQQARERDAWQKSGKPLGPLHGVPVAIKDVIDTADFPTECGAAFLAGRRPQADATVVTRLREAGAVIIGKTVTTEFAYFHPGKTRNPHDPKRTPGGSSSGSAAAVGAGMVPLAIGTQTNGSIIRPGSFCGTFALKPSHGLVSRGGVLLLSRALDHVGPFARSVEDLALALEVIAGHDRQDPDTRPRAAFAVRRAATEAPPRAPRFAFVRTPVWDKAELAARTAFEAFAHKLGDQCFTFPMPQRYDGGWDAQRVVMATEMAHNLGATVDQGGDTFSQVLRDLIAEGRKNTATNYLAALAEAKSLREGLDPLFAECDAIITPATTGVAPLGLEATGSPMFCTLWSLLGLPAVTLPLIELGGLPVGVQLVAAHGDDARLLRTANWLVAAVRG